MNAFRFDYKAKTFTSWESVQNSPRIIDDLWMIYMSHVKNVPKHAKTMLDYAAQQWDKATTRIPWLFNLFPHATLPSSTWSALRCTPQWIALMTGTASLWCSQVTPSKPCICHGLAWWSEEVSWVCQISKSSNFDWWTLQKTAHD